METGHRFFFFKSRQGAYLIIGHGIDCYDLDVSICPYKMDITIPVFSRLLWKGFQNIEF